MDNLSTAKEARQYGALGNLLDVEDMASQCKVMYDNIDPQKQGIDKDDIIRLYEIQQRLIKCLIHFERIAILNGN